MNLYLAYDDMYARMAQNSDEAALDPAYVAKEMSTYTGHDHGMIIAAETMEDAVKICHGDSLKVIHIGTANPDIPVDILYLAVEGGLSGSMIDLLYTKPQVGSDEQPTTT